MMYYASFRRQRHKNGDVLVSNFVLLLGKSRHVRLVTFRMDSIRMNSSSTLTQSECDSQFVLFEMDPSVFDSIRSVRSTIHSPAISLRQPQNFDPLLCLRSLYKLKKGPKFSVTKFLGLTQTYCW